MQDSIQVLGELAASDNGASATSLLFLEPARLGTILTRHKKYIMLSSKNHWFSK